MDIRRSIRKYILENFLFSDNDSALNDDTSFLEQGIIDSTGVLELVNWIEEQFETKVADEDLIPDNFDSVNKLAEYIMRKKSS